MTLVHLGIVNEDALATIDLSSAKEIKDSDVLDIVDFLYRSRTIKNVTLNNQRIPLQVASALGHALTLGAIPHSQLTEVRLNNCNITEDVLKAFLFGMRHEGPSTKLRTLDLGNNSFADGGTVYLATVLRRLYNNSEVTVSLRTLVLSSRIGRKGCVALGEMLAASSSPGCQLENLNLAHNSLYVAGVEAICEGLRDNNSLRFLNISENNIKRDGGRALATMLKENKMLEGLEMANNYISDAFSEITNALALRGTCMRILDLSKNRINTAAAIPLLNQKPFYALQISLAKNPLGDEGLKAVVHSIKGTPVEYLDLGQMELTTKSGDVLAELVRSCPMLSSLQLDGNFMLGDEACAKVFYEIVTSSRTLVSLNLDNCSMGTEAVASLSVAIQKRGRFRSIVLADNKLVNITLILAALGRYPRKQHALEYLDVTGTTIDKSDDSLKLLIDIFAANPKLPYIIIERTAMKIRLNNSDVMTRAMAITAVEEFVKQAAHDEERCSASAVRWSKDTCTALITTRVLNGELVPAGSNGASAAIANKAAHKVMEAALYHPVWAVQNMPSADQEGLYDEDDSGDDGDAETADVPLIPGANSVQHSLYPSLGKGQFSSHQHIQVINNPIPYNMILSNGFSKPLCHSCDATESFVNPTRQFKRYHPYSLYSLERNKSLLPVTPDMLRQKWCELDVENKGFLDKKWFKQLYLQFENFGVEMSDRELDDVLKKYGTQDEERLTYDEFCILMLRFARM